MESTLSVDGSSEPVSKVDAALGAWRHETVQRRAVWDLRAEQDALEQATRRRRLTRFAAVGFAGLGLGAALATVVVTGAVAWQRAPAASSGIDAAPALARSSGDAHPIPTLAAGPQVQAPIPTVAAVVPVDVAPAEPLRAPKGAGEPAARAVPRPGADLGALGVLGSARQWQSRGALWVQFDYAGAPLVLRWTDAAGSAVLEPTPCVNVLSDDVRRCYVGRTDARVKMALAAGATPGHVDGERVPRRPLCAGGSFRRALTFRPRAQRSVRSAARAW
jgi:hypothetical protein